MGCNDISRVDKLIELFAREGRIPYSTGDCENTGYTEGQCDVLRTVTEQIRAWNSIKGEVEGEIAEKEPEKMRQVGIPDEEIKAIRNRATLARIDHLIDAYPKAEDAGIKLNYLSQLGIVGRKNKGKVLPIIRGVFSDPRIEAYDTSVKEGFQQVAVEALDRLNDRDSIPLFEDIARSGSYASGVQMASARVLCWFGAPKLPEIFLANRNLIGACPVENYSAQFSDKAQLSKDIENMLKVKVNGRSPNLMGTFAVGLLEKHAAELGASEVIRLANIGLGAHSSSSDPDAEIRGKVFKVIETLPDSPELREFLKDIASSSAGGYGLTWVLSEISRRGYKDLLPHLFAADFVRGSIPSFGSWDSIPSLGSRYLRLIGAEDRRETLAKFGEDILPFLEPIVKYNKSEEIRLEAVVLLSRVAGEKATELLALAMDDPAEKVRHVAGQRLAGRGELEALKTKLKSKRPEVRRTAISAFLNYSDYASAYSLITSYAKADRDESVRNEARSVIKGICNRDPDLCSDKLIEMSIGKPVR